MAASRRMGVDYIIGNGATGPHVSFDAPEACPMYRVAAQYDKAETICGDCYTKNEYQSQPNTKTAYARNHALAVNDPDRFWWMLEDEAVDVQYLRMFAGGGDIINPAWGDALSRVLERLQVRTYIPTKVARLPEFYGCLDRLCANPRTCVRDTPLWRNVDPREDGCPDIPGLRYAAVLDQHIACYAMSFCGTPIDWLYDSQPCPNVLTDHGGTCAGIDCRRCWDTEIPLVWYPLHPHGGYRAPYDPFAELEEPAAATSRPTNAKKGGRLLCPRADAMGTAIGSGQARTAEANVAERILLTALADLTVGAKAQYPGGIPVGMWATALADRGVGRTTFYDAKGRLERAGKIQGVGLPRSKNLKYLLR